MFSLEPTGDIMEIMEIMEIITIMGINMIMEIITINVKNCDYNKKCFKETELLTVHSEP